VVPGLAAPLAFGSLVFPTNSVNGGDNTVENVTNQIGERAIILNNESGEKP